MAQAIAVEKVEKYTNYSGLDDGAEPVLVYRKAKFVVVNVGEPKADSFFGGSEFREVKFVEVGTANVFKNSLFEGHYPRLTSTLAEGNVVEVEYQVGSGWIRSINGKGWN